MVVQQQDKTTTEAQASIIQLIQDTSLTQSFSSVNIKSTPQSIVMPRCLNGETEAPYLAMVTARNKTEISQRLPELTDAKAS